MSVVRFNMAHRSSTEHTVTLERLRAAAKELGVHVAAMMDTGHSIFLTGPLKTPDVQLHQGSQVRIVTDREIEGDATTISCNHRKLSDHVDIGDTLLLDDGSLTLKVSGVGPHIIDTVAMNATRLTPRRKLVVLGKPLSTQSATSDITTWAEPNNVDIVVVPGLLTKRNVVALRLSLGTYRPLIFGKVNTVESIEACTTILEELDGVVISRGDLALALAPEKIAMIQKFVVEKCNAAGKPTFISTQVLESMADCPRPTRAEVSDVANAVLDGTDGMILSARIEEGQYALEALEAMTRTCREAERAVIEEDLFARVRSHVTRPIKVPNAIASAGIMTAMEIQCKLLLTISSSGNTARELARYRPKAAILAVTASEAVANQMSALRGVT
ncbi:MAG: uncharacterized protein KVP18_001833 [Porospora cf. gigantea A]|nr:MAG: hypothetical protein KVP18_001833 [Porospora cf. gigantea A]